MKVKYGQVRTMTERLIQVRRGQKRINTGTVRYGSVTTGTKSLKLLYLSIFKLKMGVTPLFFNQ